VTGLTEDEARALFVHSTGGAHEDLGLGNAARSAVLKVMRAVPAPFRPAATATSQLILVDPERWMRARDPVGHLGVLQAAVFTGRRLRMRYRSGGDVEVLSPPEVRDDLAAVAADTVSLYSRTLHDRTRV
jgi:predicted DNA-binding transcriptional regulator YafY